MAQKLDDYKLTNRTDGGGDNEDDCCVAYGLGFKYAQESVLGLEETFSDMALAQLEPPYQVKSASLPASFGRSAYRTKSKRNRSKTIVDTSGGHELQTNPLERSRKSPRAAPMTSPGLNWSSFTSSLTPVDGSSNNNNISNTSKESASLSPEPMRVRASERKANKDEMIRLTRSSLKLLNDLNDGIEKQSIMEEIENATKSNSSTTTLRKIGLESLVEIISKYENDANTNPSNQELAETIETELYNDCQDDQGFFDRSTYGNCLIKCLDLLQIDSLRACIREGDLCSIRILIDIAQKHHNRQLKREERTRRKNEEDSQYNNYDDDMNNDDDDLPSIAEEEWEEDFFSHQQPPEQFALAL